MRPALKLIPFVFAVVMACPAHAQEKCTLHRAASLPMMVTESGRITVPMTFGGVTVDMLVDTGSPGTGLSQEMAEKIGLDIHHTMAGRAFYGGRRVTETTVAHNVALDSLKMDTFPVGIMPDELDPGAEGLLGQDIMSAYDLDFDFAGGKLNFYSTDHCEGRVVYWTDTPVAVIPFMRDGADHVLVKVALDGKEFWGALDTGNPRTVADWNTVAGALRLTESSTDVKPNSEGHTPGYTYPFKSLSFGGITVNHPDVTLVPTKLSGMGYGNPVVVLGINVLRQFHLYIANGEQKLYVTSASAH